MKISPKFFAFPVHKVPDGLLGNVMEAIHKKERRNARVKFGFSFAGFVFSLFLLIPVWGNLVKAAFNSGVGEYLSLLFTNFNEIMVSWQDYVFSLLESLPVLSMVSFLAVILIMLFSMAFIARNIKMTFYRF